MRLPVPTSIPGVCSPCHMVPDLWLTLPPAHLPWRALVALGCVVLLVRPLGAQRVVQAQQWHRPFVAPWHPASGNPLHVLREARKRARPLALHRFGGGSAPAPPARPARLLPPATPRLEPESDEVPLAGHLGRPMPVHGAPHFINHTHLSFITADVPLETEAFTPCALALVDLRTQLITRIPLDMSGAKDPVRCPVLSPTQQFLSICLIRVSRGHSEHANGLALFGEFGKFRFDVWK